jgi:hypothetical protein
MRGTPWSCEELLFVCVCVCVHMYARIPVLLGIKHMSLQMLGKHSTTETQEQILYTISMGPVLNREKRENPIVALVSPCPSGCPLKHLRGTPGCKEHSIERHGTPNLVSAKLSLNRI